MKTEGQKPNRRTQKETQPIYSSEEFAASHAVLNASEDLIRAAFRYSGKETATQKEAIEMINTFKEMEA